MVEPDRYSEELNQPEDSLGDSKDVAQVRKIGCLSAACRVTQMECLEIKPTSLLLPYSHFRGIGFSIKANGSSRLVSLCCGLRSCFSLPAPRHVSSVKMLTRKRRGGRYDVAVPRPQRVGCDDQQRYEAELLPVRRGRKPLKSSSLSS